MPWMTPCAVGDKVQLRRLTTPSCEYNRGRLHLSSIACLAAADLLRYIARVGQCMRMLASTRPHGDTCRLNVGVAACGGGPV
jgi:hypothetical protein